MYCFIHLTKQAAGACVSCGNLFCVDCLTLVKNKNHCKQCVAELLETKHKEHEKLQEQIEREKDRAAMRGGSSPNIVVTTTTTGGSASSSSAASASSASGGASPKYVVVSGRGRPPRVEPIKAAILGLLFPGLGHAYLGRKYTAAIFMATGALCSLILLAALFAPPTDKKGTVDAGLRLMIVVIFGWPWPTSSYLAYRGALKTNAQRWQR